MIEGRRLEALRLGRALHDLPIAFAVGAAMFTAMFAWMAGEGRLAYGGWARGRRRVFGSAR